MKKHINLSLLISGVDVCLLGNQVQKTNDNFYKHTYTFVSQFDVFWFLWIGSSLEQSSSQVDVLTGAFFSET